MNEWEKLEGNAYLHYEGDDSDGFAKAISSSVADCMNRGFAALVYYDGKHADGKPIFIVEAVPHPDVVARKASRN